MSVSESVITKIVQRRGVRQFVKFCIVGGMSTVIDLGLHWVLMFGIVIHGEFLSHIVGQQVWSWMHPGVLATDKDLTNASFAILKIVPVGLAILNSFFWNRLWTFRVQGKESMHKQIVKFYVIALTGMVLNVIIATGMFNVIPGHPKRSWAIASLVAMVLVSFWNFFGQKLWTFKKDMR